MIHDFAQRDNRAFPGGKPTTTEFTGISKVVIAVHEFDSAVDRYRQAYDLPMPKLQGDAAFGARLTWFPGTPVVLASPLGPESWLRARLQQFGEAPCTFILGVRSIASHMAPSKWFGTRIFWAYAAQLGWHLGFLPK
jgi:hypothetical protein